VQVVRYRPGVWFWWCLPFAIAGVATIAYLLGSAGGSVQSPEEQLSAKQAQFDLDRMDELRAELTELRLAQTADVGSNNEVRASFRELQSEIASLEEEVAFYRSLMAPKELAKGLRIEKMILNSTGRRGVFGYELVLAQTVARHAWQQGEMYFEVHGAVAGERAVLALTEIATIPEYHPRNRHCDARSRLGGRDHSAALRLVGSGCRYRPEPLISIRKIRELARLGDCPQVERIRYVQQKKATRKKPRI